MQGDYASLDFCFFSSMEKKKAYRRLAEARLCCWFIILEGCYSQQYFYRSIPRVAFSFFLDEKRNKKSRKNDASPHKASAWPACLR
jgi:hypothetical protein